MSAPAPTPSPRRRWWLAIPLALVALLLVAFVYFLLRGTWTAGTERDPSTSEEGVLVQLVKHDAGTAVRCAAVFDRPVEEVWGRLTDFAHFGEMFSTLENAEGGANDDGTGWLRGTARGSHYVGSWPIDLVLKPEKDGERRILSWDSPLGDLKVCKGRIVLTPLDKKRTLVAYTLEVRTGSYPQWVTNNTLLNRNPQALASLRAAVERKP